MFQNKTFFIPAMTLLTLFLVAGFNACSQNVEFEEMAQKASTVGEPDKTPSTPPPDDDDVVCNPLGEGEGGSIDSGLKGDIYYLSAESRQDNPNSKSLEDYFEEGLLAEQKLYVDQLFAPTLFFDFGFASQEGQFVTDNDGQKLEEYFALHFRSYLTLQPDQPEGLYELAVISDDGSRVYVDGELAIDNDGTHSTKMGCTNQALSLSHGEPLPLDVEYYQGPRHEIALVLLMRPAGSGSDFLCQAGAQRTLIDENVKNYTFEPNENWATLQQEGWDVIPPANFILPDNEVNPCD